MNVLVIDDEPELLGIFSEILTMHGFTCETVNSFAKAKEKIAERPYSFYIIDILLEEFNGLDLVPLIKEKCLDQKPKIIVSSGNISRDSDLQADVWKICPKPYSLFDIATLMKDEMGKQNAELPTCC